MAEDTRTSINPAEIKGKEPIDYQAYNYMESKIETVEIHNYAKEGESEQLRLVISTSRVDDTNELRGKEFVNLFRDKEGNVCYSKSPNSVAQKILMYFNVADFNELIGMKCNIRVRMLESGKKVLGIDYG